MFYEKSDEDLISKLDDFWKLDDYKSVIYDRWKFHNTINLDKLRLLRQIKVVRALFEFNLSPIWNKHFTGLFVQYGVSNN